MTTTQRFYTTTTPTFAGAGTAWTNAVRLKGPADGSLATVSSVAHGGSSRLLTWLPDADTDWPTDGSRTITAVRCGAKVQTSNAALASGSTTVNGSNGDGGFNITSTLAEHTDSFSNTPPTITGQNIYDGAMTCTIQLTNIDDILTTTFSVDTVFMEIDWIPTPASGADYRSRKQRGRAEQSNNRRHIR